MRSRLRSSKADERKQAAGVAQHASDEAARTLPGVRPWVQARLTKLRERIRSKHPKPQATG